MQTVFLHWYSLPHSPADAYELTSSLTLTLWDHETSTVFEQPLEAYVFSVTAAEMPAIYHPEALKAQAVAARTRAIASARKLGGNGCKTNPACDLCTNASCCQAYSTDDMLRDRWGAEYAFYHSRIVQAVKSTRSEILTYQGMPIQVLYHASSGGTTEDAQSVFSQAIPYLVSVASPGEEFFSGYTDSVTYSLQEAADLLLLAFPDCQVTPDGLSAQLRLQSSTDSGRIASILVGTQVVTGPEFRSALKLRSTFVTWDTTDKSITFHTRGYGHGVGMSQAGANAMAAQNKTYCDILHHYYPGTNLSLSAD